MDGRWNGTADADLRVWIAAQISKFGEKSKWVRYHLACQTRMTPQAIDALIAEVAAEQKGKPDA